MKDSQRPFGDINELYLRSTLMLLIGLPAYCYFFVPRFAAFVNDFGSPLPYPAQMMVSLSNNMGSNTMPATMVVTVLLLLGNLAKERLITNPRTRLKVNYGLTFGLLLIFIAIILSTFASLIPLVNDLLA